MIFVKGLLLLGYSVFALHNLVTQSLKGVSTQGLGVGACSRNLTQGLGVGERCLFGLHI